MIEVQAPDHTQFDNGSVKIFLAGTIEMGKSFDWQKDLIENHLSKYDNLIVYNPRRLDWDSSWKQTVDDPRFVEQVEWELDRLEESDIILIHFEPKTVSPISLLEMGLFWDKNVIVHCPEGYERKGNVDITCKRFGVAQIENILEVLPEIENML